MPWQPRNCKSTQWELEMARTFNDGVEHTVIKAYTYIDLAQILLLLKSLRRFLYSDISLHHTNHSVLCITSEWDATTNPTNHDPFRSSHPASSGIPYRSCIYSISRTVKRLRYCPSRNQTRHFDCVSCTIWYHTEAVLLAVKTEDKDPLSAGHEQPYYDSRSKSISLRIHIRHSSFSLPLAIPPINTNPLWLWTSKEIAYFPQFKQSHPGICSLHTWNESVVHLLRSRIRTKKPYFTLSCFISIGTVSILQPVIQQCPCTSVSHGTAIWFPLSVVRLRVQSHILSILSHMLLL